MTEEMTLSTIYIPNVDYALSAWKGYQELCLKLLDDSDYAIIEGKKHRKRSGWTKLRRAFSITTEVVEQSWETLDDGAFGYYVTVRAVFPDGRYEDGDGYCDSSEFRRGRLKATRHNVRSKAITRAKNRATADLIGSGEVSAEEMPIGHGNVPRKARPTQKKQANGSARPLEPLRLKDFLHKKADEVGSDIPVTEKQIPFVARKFQEAFAGESEAELKYHSCLLWLWGVDSAKHLTMAQAKATLDWLLDPAGKDETGDIPLHEHAPEEAQRVLRVAMEDAGQSDMFNNENGVDEG